MSLTQQIQCGYQCLSLRSTSKILKYAQKHSFRMIRFSFSIPSTEIDVFALDCPLHFLDESPHTSAPLRSACISAKSHVCSRHCQRSYVARCCIKLVHVAVMCSVKIVGSERSLITVKMSSLI